MSHVISQTQDELPCKEEGLDSMEESKCPTHRRNVESLFHNAIRGSIEPAKIVKHDKFRDSCSDKSLSSLVTVRSHQRKMPGSSKKKRSTPKSKIRKNLLADFKRVGTMDVASFREISRIQSVENETFKALKASSGSTGSRNKQIWNGFWSMAAKMESKKKRKPFTVIQSKKKKTKKTNSQVVQPMEKMDDVKKSNRQVLQPMKQMDDMESVQMDNMESVQMDDMPIARLLDNL